MPGSADSRLNIILTANNTQANQALQATAQDVEKMSESMVKAGKVGEESGNLLYAKIQGLREVIEYTLDGLNLLGSSFGKTAVSATKLDGAAKAVDGLAVNLGKAGVAAGSMSKAIAFTAEYGEMLYRTAETAKGFADTIGAIPGIVNKNKEALEEYVGELENNPFIKAASNVETLELRLKSLYGSEKIAAEQMKYLYSEAAKGGFQSQGLMEAGIVLKELNQDLSKTIPLVEELAAGTGEDLTTAATAIGNAFSGIDTGFTQLQRTFHLTRDQLIQMGAAVDQFNDIQNLTSKQILQNQSVIEKAANTKYGDVVKQNAETIRGAFNGIHESIERVMEMVGESMKKPTVDFINTMADTVRKVTTIVAPMFEFFKNNTATLIAPISLVSNVLNKMASVGVDAFNSVGEKINSVSQAMEDGGFLKNVKEAGKELGVMGLTAAAVGTKMAFAMSSMAIFNVGFIALAKTVEATSGVLYAFTGIPFAKTVAEWAGSQAIMAAGFLRAIPIFIGATAAISAIGVGLYYTVSAMKEAEAAEKSYQDGVSKTVEVTSKYSYLIGKSTEELKKHNVTIGESKGALEYMRSNYEKATNELENFKKEVASDPVGAGAEKMFAQIFGGETTWEEKIKMLERNQKRARDLMEKNSKALRENITDKGKDKNEEDSSGQGLIKASMDLEEKYRQFQVDSSAGYITTKAQEARAINEIYEQSAKNRINLENTIADQETAIEKETDSKKKEEEEKTLAFLSELRQRQLNMEKETANQAIAINAAAAQERMQKIEESYQFEINMGKMSENQRIASMRSFLKAEGSANAARLGAKKEWIEKEAKAEEDLKNAQTNGDKEQAKKEVAIASQKIKEIEASDKLYQQTKLQLERELAISERRIHLENMAMHTEEMDQVKQMKDLEMEYLEQRADRVKPQDRSADLQKERQLIEQSAEIALKENENNKNAALEALGSAKDVTTEEKRRLIVEKANTAESQIQNKLSYDRQKNIDAQNHALAEQAQMQQQLVDIDSARRQAEEESLENRQSHGENVYKEIEANRKIAEQKELEAIEAQRKIDHLNDDGNKRSEQIDKASEERKYEVRQKYAIEAANRKIAEDERAAQKEVTAAEQAEKQIAADKLKYETDVLSGKQGTKNAFQTELQFQEQIYQAQLKTLEATLKEAKAHGNIIESQKAQKQYDIDRENLENEHTKAIILAQAKENSAKADSAQKEVENQKEIFDAKVESGQLGVQSAALAKKETDMIEKNAQAQIAALRAKKDEAVASADVADKERVARDYEIQIQKAVRDTQKAVLDVNKAVAGGNSELDKEVKKYNKILEALNKINDKESEEDDPALKEPDNSGIYANSIGGFSESVRKADLEKMKADSESKQASINGSIAAASNSQTLGDLKFKQDQDLAKSMSAEGKTQEEIRDAINKLNKDLDDSNNSNQKPKTSGTTDAKTTGTPSSGSTAPTSGGNSSDAWDKTPGAPASAKSSGGQTTASGVPNQTIEMMAKDLASCAASLLVLVQKNGAKEGPKSSLDSAPKSDKPRLDDPNKIDPNSDPNSPQPIAQFTQSEQLKNDVFTMPGLTLA